VVCLKVSEQIAKIAGLLLLTITPCGLGLSIKDLYGKPFIL
jgi:hypothetical protein